MTRDLYEAAMEWFIDEYLDEHQDADEQDAYEAWMRVDTEYFTDYLADRGDWLYQQHKDSRREHI
jgi:hypothetical protein